MLLLNAVQGSNRCLLGESCETRCVVYFLVLNVAACRPVRTVDFKGLSGLGEGDMEWIDLTRNRGRWRTFVNAVINIRVP